ncbi:serine-rich adhesin for platelets-like [Haliotis asinina]|uniref:serine-rich adhesin for platelets-like n=1 Tax=Haliotis asinina TaxID=109174 RepID=UPI00353274B2
MKAKASTRAKKLKGKSEVFLQSLVNRNIGSRTGKDVKAGKLIDKDEDGFDNFDAYWSESDADLTNNTTFHSKLSSVSGQPEKENQAHTTDGHTSTLKSVDSCTVSSLKVGGTGTYYLGNRIIGSRTGKNIKAGKNIRRCDDGIENFDDYWSESEAESILSFHRSIRANDTRSFLGADMPQERDENISSINGEDGSEGEVVINPRHQQAVTGWENSGWEQDKDSEGDEQGDGAGHAKKHASELVEDNLDGGSERQICPDTRSVQDSYTQHQQSLGHKQSNNIPEDSTVSSSSDHPASRSEQSDLETEMEDAESKPESTQDCCRGTVEVPLEQSSQSTCSESSQDDDVTGTVLKRPDSLSRSRLSHIMQLQAHGEEEHVTNKAASIQLEIVQKPTMSDKKADSSSQMTENSQVQQSGELSSPVVYSSKGNRSKFKTTLNRSRHGKKSLGDKSDPSISEDVTGRLSTRRTRSQSKQSLGTGEIQPVDASSNKGRKQNKSVLNSCDWTDGTEIQSLELPPSKGRRQKKSLSNSGNVTDDTEIQPLEPSSIKGRKHKKSLSNSGNVTDDTEIQPLEPSSSKGRKQKKSLSNSGNLTDDTEVQPLEPSSIKGRKQKKSLSNSGNVTDDTEIQPLEPSSSKGRKQKKSLSNSGNVTDDTEIQPLEPSSSKGRKQKSLSNSGNVTDDTEIQPLEPSSSKGRKQKSLSNSGNVTDDTEIQPLEPSPRKGRKQKSLSNSGNMTDDTEIQPLEPSSGKRRKQKKSLSNSGNVTDDTEIQPLEPSFSKDRKQKKSLSNSGNVTVQQTLSETAVKVLSSGRNNRCKDITSYKSSCADINANVDENLTGKSNKKENQKLKKILKSARCRDHEKSLTQGKAAVVPEADKDATNADQQESEASVDATDGTHVGGEAHIYHTDSDQEEPEAGSDHTNSDQEQTETVSDHTNSDQEEMEAVSDHTNSDQEEMEAVSDHSNDDQAELGEGSAHTYNIVTDHKILEKVEQSSKERVHGADHEMNNSPVSKVSSVTGRNKSATSSMHHTSQMPGAFDMDEKQDESNATKHGAKQDKDSSGTTVTASNLCKDDAPPSEHFNTPGDLPCVNKQARHSCGGDITLAGFNDQALSQKSVSVAGLDIGGDVTGSISKNTNGTLSIIPSHTPMLSFRTKKRLSYSKLLNDSLEKRSLTDTSGSVPVVSGLTQPPPLESVVEEESTGDHGDTDGANTDFLCLRPASINRRSSHRPEEGLDSTEEEFWMVDEKPPMKKKTVKKSLSPKNSVKQKRKSGGDVMEENTVRETKTTRRKTENVKKSAGKDVKSAVVSEANIVAEDENGLLQHALFTDTPTSCNPRKRKSSQQPASNSGVKKSKAARVTKTRVMMKGTRKPAVTKGSLSRLSHLSITVPCETPKSGVSFRQRRRTSVSDSELSSMNMSCPAEFSAQSVDSIRANKHGKNTSSSLKETIVSTSPKVKPLTPCLTNSTVKSVRKKKRRVTISNIVEKASVSYSDSTVSENELKTGDSPNCSNSVPNISDVTGSPVHIFEMTNTATPVPITAPPKSKIIYPQPAPEGLRRSNRVRLKPIEWFKNEHVIYERRKSGTFVIAGVKPSKESEYLAAEAEKRKRRVARMKKTKETKSSKLSRNKLLAKANLSVHTVLSPTLDYTVSSDIPVMNPETQEEVLVDCVAPVDGSLYVGPSGDSPCEGDPYIICHAIQQPAFTVGHLLICPLGEKPTQALEDNTLIFTIVHGKLSVTIHRGSTVLEAGDQFFVPRGNTYSLKNLRNEEAKLSFVNLMESISS